MKKWLLFLCCFFYLSNSVLAYRYVVIKKGQTLWRISKQYNVPIETLCKLNNITDKTKVKTGMKIYLPSKENNVKPDNTPKFSLKLRLENPVEGTISSKFHEGENLIAHNGIEFEAKEGSKVKSASDGEVNYTGSLRGYGQVIIVQYNKEVSMIYAFLSKILVNRGDNIKSGQTIGVIGQNPISKKNILHFELLYNSKPVNPLQYFKK